MTITDTTNPTIDNVRDMMKDILNQVISKGQQIRFSTPHADGYYGLILHPNGSIECLEYAKIFYTKEDTIDDITFLDLAHLTEAAQKYL